MPMTRSQRFWTKPWSAVAVEVGAGLIFSVVLGVVFWHLTNNADQRRADRDERLENLRFVRTASGDDPSVVRAFASIDLEGQTITGLNLSGADFTGANLQDVDLLQAVIPRGRFDLARMNDALANNANLRGASFLDAELRGLEAAGVDFAGALLAYADFTDADLYDANMPRAAIEGADFSRAKLVMADLQRVSTAPESGEGPPQTSFDEADLTCAELHGADLRGSTGLDTAVLDRVRYDESTRWPDEFVPPPTSPNESCSAFTGFSDGD